MPVTAGPRWQLKTSPQGSRTAGTFVSVARLIIPRQSSVTNALDDFRDAQARNKRIPRARGRHSVEADVNAHQVTRPRRRRWFALRVWGNPLARGVDRAEAIFIVGLLMIWLLTLPLIATVASVEWTSIDSRLAADRVTDIAVDAVLTGDASPILVTREAIGATTASAYWTGRDGQPTSGVVHVAAGARSGEHITVWLDATGKVVAQPMSSVAAAGLTALAAGIAWLGLGLTMIGIWWAVRRRFDRLRWIEWEREWKAFTSGRTSS